MNESLCRSIVRERSGELCEICPRRAAHMHHRRNRSQGGRWEPSNILHICADDHDWIGKNISAAVRNGWSIQGTQEQPWDVSVVRRGERVLLDNYGDYEAAA